MTGIDFVLLLLQFEVGDSLAILKTVLWRTPLKAKRFESHNDFLLLPTWLRFAPTISVPKL